MSAIAQRVGSAASDNAPSLAKPPEPVWPSLRWGHILAFIASLALLRLVVGAQLGLGDAEAYYWTWSQRLAGGYLDHGPMVALLIRLSTGVFGHSPLGVRAVFVVVSSLLLVLVALVTRRWTGSLGLAGLGVLIVSAMPAFFIAGGAANPDVPFCTLVMLACWIASVPGASHRLVPMLGFGLCVGLATSTKLFGVLLIPALLALSWRHHRPAWAFLGSSSVAVVGALPLILWNAQRGWPTLQYHLIDRHTATVGPAWLNLGKLVGGQLAYVSPWLLVLFAVTAASLWRDRRAAGSRRALWLGGPLILGAYALICIVPGAEPHWPLAGYLPLVAGASAALAAAYAENRRVRHLSWLAGTATLALFALFYAHMLTDYGVSLMPRSYVPRYDLSNELMGWPEVADRTARAIEELRRERPVVATGCHYTSCSQLRFAARGRFDVRCISPRVDQFDLMPGGDGATLRHIDVLYLWDERFPFDAERLYRCTQVERVGRIPIDRAGRTVRRFELQLCRDFDGLKATRWPPRATVRRTN